MSAGHETTTNPIGNGLVALLRHPEMLARLRREPDLIESAVEEMLRYDGTTQRHMRVAAQEVELDGHRIGKHQLVFAMVGAANRDPAQFPHPDRFDITRSNNRHVTFGHGIHFCVGAALARLETKIAINTMLERTGARAALAITKGFRDIYEIGRINRPDSYNLFFKKHRPLIERAMCFELDERMRGMTFAEEQAYVRDRLRSRSNGPIAGVGAARQEPGEQQHAVQGIHRGRAGRDYTVTRLHTNGSGLTLRRAGR